MKEPIKSYQDLVVWQRSMELAIEVYDLTRKFPSEERFGLSDQIRTSAVSVSANITEGQGRNHPKEFAQFLGIAKGSLSELESLLILASRLGYLSEEDLRDFSEKIISIRRPLYGLLLSLRGR